MPLDYTELDFFQKNGYLIVDSFLASKRCDELQEEADRIAQGYYCNLLSLHKKSEIFFDLINHASILTMLDQLTGEKMIAIGSIFFFCKPGNELEKGSNFHQDNYAAKAPHGAYLTVGLALDEADESNGSLVVYPGTHLLEDLECEPSKNFEKDETGKILKSYPIGNLVDIPKGYDHLQLKYKRGSLIFIHGHLIHGAPENPSSTKWRRKVYLNYIKDGSPFWPGWSSKRQIIDRDSKFTDINK